jgi:hypothetical protein
MRSCCPVLLGLAVLAFVPWLAGLPAAECGVDPAPDLAPDHAAGCAADHRGCTAERPCSPCVPECRSSWDEKKSRNTKYSMLCDYACARARECWCTGPAECRCSPPCGRVYVRKKLFKEEKEEVERVPKYKVKMVPAPACDCADCRHCHRLCWWDPLGLLSCFGGW